MPTTIRHEDSGQVKFAQDWEVESYTDLGWVVDESATQDADGVNKNPESSDDLQGEVADAGRPNQSDTKDVWVDYAKTHGYDESEGLTKAELIESYGG